MSALVSVTQRHAHLLSNGRYTVMLTPAGSGFSRRGDLAVSRWREDPTCDGWGSYVLLSDFSSGAAWSACLQPYGGDADAHVSTFSEGRAEFAWRDATLTATLDVAIASDQDTELRRVTLTNHGDAALALCAPLRTLDASERTLAGAAEWADAERARFGIDAAQAERCGRLVGPLLIADAAWRSASLHYVR